MTVSKKDYNTGLSRCLHLYLTSMCQWLTSTFENLWMYCPGHARMKGNDWADRLVGKAIITCGLCLRRSHMLRSLRHYLCAQSQGHHIIDHLEERGMEEEALSDLPWKDKRRALSITRTLELFQRHHWEDFRETGWSVYGLFLSM